MKFGTGDATGYSVNTKAGSVPSTALATETADGNLPMKVIRETVSLVDKTDGTFSLTTSLPANAIIQQVFMKVNTAITDTAAGATTVGINYAAPNDVVVATAISGAPWSTLGVKATLVDGTFGAMLTQAPSAPLAYTVLLGGGATKIVAGNVTFWIEYVA